MIDVETQKMVNEGLGNFVADQLEKLMPVTAAFRGYGLRFEICGTENEGLLKLEYHSPGMVFGQLGVYRQGTLILSLQRLRKTCSSICGIRQPTGNGWIKSLISHKVWRITGHDRRIRGSDQGVGSFFGTAGNCPGFCSDL